MSGRRPVRLHAVTMLELEDRYLCEQLRLNMGAAARLLEDAGAALDRRDAPLARAVLGTESFGDPGMRPLPRAARADAMVEMVSELAMGVAELARTEFRLLSVLASERGRVMTRDQLQQRVWGTPYRPRDRSVDVCVRKLREKLDQRSNGFTYIHTHYGVGYRFDAEPRRAVIEPTA